MCCAAHCRQELRQRANGSIPRQRPSLPGSAASMLAMICQVPVHQSSYRCRDDHCYLSVCAIWQVMHCFRQEKAANITSDCNHVVNCKFMAWWTLYFAVCQSSYTDLKQAYWHKEGTCQKEVSSDVGAAAAFGKNSCCRPKSDTLILNLLRIWSRLS